MTGRPAGIDGTPGRDERRVDWICLTPGRDERRADWICLTPGYGVTGRGPGWTAGVADGG